MKMKKICLLGSVMAFLFICFLIVYAEEKAVQSSPYEIFLNKCTKCHDKEQALKRHESKTYWIDVVRRMTMEHGVKVSSEESDAIVKMLAEPDRKVFEDKCSKCHPLDRISSYHETDGKAKEVTEKMSKKDGANISEDEKKKVEKYLEYRNKPTFPLSPQR